MITCWKKEKQKKQSKKPEKKMSGIFTNLIKTINTPNTSYYYSKRSGAVKVIIIYYVNT